MAICLTGTSNVWGGSITNKSSWGFTTGQSDCSFYSIFIGKQSIQWSRQDITSSSYVNINYPIIFTSKCFIVIDAILLSYTAQGVSENVISIINNTYCQLKGFSTDGIGIILALGY